jgi:FMN reductase
VLTEIGGSVPVRGLYVVDSAFDDPAAYESWLATARRHVRLTEAGHV